MNFSDKQFFILLGVAALGLYAAKQGAAKLNPTNPDNVFYGFSNDVTKIVAGRETDKFGRELTLGAYLHEVLN